MTQKQVRIPATYMRGGTSKGVFFRLEDLPLAAQQPGAARNALLSRIIGSPDPYGKHTDGMGGATSSTSKCAIVSRSNQPGHDVDYLYGQINIDSDLVDWSGNCGNLSAAVGPFAIHSGLIDPARLPKNGSFEVRIWQANIGQTILARVPIRAGSVQELGEFELDGVSFPAAEIELDFVGSDGDADAPAIFPTGAVSETLDVPELGSFEVTLINSGVPTAFFKAAELGLRGDELQGEINGDEALLARLERLRSHSALKMGLIKTLAEAATKPLTPKLAFVAAKAAYVASSGKHIEAGDIDLLVRALSMGKLHHAMMATCAVAIGTAAAIPGTVVNQAIGGGARESVRFGHPSGRLWVGASVSLQNGRWRISKASMSRSARRLMEGWVLVPERYSAELTDRVDRAPILPI